MQTKAKLLEGQRGCAEGIISDAEKLDECRMKLLLPAYINQNGAGPDAAAAGVPAPRCETTLLPTVFFYIFRKYNITKNPPTAPPQASASDSPPAQRPAGVRIGQASHSAHRHRSGTSTERNASLRKKLATSNKD